MAKLSRLPAPILIGAIGFLSGCATVDYSRIDETYIQAVAPDTVLHAIAIEPEIEERVLKLDPERVTGNDIRDTLSYAPAPRIFNIHGGIYPVHLMMKNFSEFLIGMGYPEERIRHPRTGAYSHSGYVSSVKLAGTIAWHYEREAMRPMVVGHSLGGIQAIKVLYQYAGHFEDEIAVYNPITGEVEARHSIIDPFSGAETPVVGGVRLSFVGALASGGLGLILPNQWNMNGLSRTIPDTVDEFAGYDIPGDFFGGDDFAGGGDNQYKASGDATVRNVTLPPDTFHMTAPGAKHLLEDPEIRDWINDEYVPSAATEPHRRFGSSAKNLLWAADVWHRIKSHWVRELQRLIRAKRALRNESSS